MSTHRRTARALVAAVLGNLVVGVVLTTAPAFAADGVASDSGPSPSCSSGYYYCWSNAQQKNVCTTRKCYN